MEKPKAEATPINENEIRITAQGRMRNYITYATTLLQVPPFSFSYMPSMAFFFFFLAWLILYNVCLAWFVDKYS